MSRCLRRSFVCFLLSSIFIAPVVQCQEPDPSPSVITVNDLLAEVGRTAPGFGGMFVDEKKDTLYVFMVDGGPDSAAAVDRAITEVLGSDRPSQTRIEVLQAQFTFVQLKDWHDQMSIRVLAIPGTVLTAIDQARNRLLVGVETLAIEPDISTELGALGVPREAVTIEEMPGGPESPSDSLESQVEEAPGDDLTLRSKIRPLVGGIQIYKDKAGAGACTLGFIAVKELSGKTEAGFVTASHCTDTKGGVEGTKSYQPMAREKEKPEEPPPLIPANQIGLEKLDPCYWTSKGAPFPDGCKPPPKKPTPECPADKDPKPGQIPRHCRYSDSAFFVFAKDAEGDITNKIGLIARPQKMNSTTLPASPLA